MITAERNTQLTMAIVELQRRMADFAYQQTGRGRCDDAIDVSEFEGKGTAKPEVEP